jgi:predicted dithiol-disulfide oxidoreductase (DUF899 family)
VDGADESASSMNTSHLRRMAYYALLDRTPKGRDESDTTPHWARRHDEYETS